MSEYGPPDGGWGYLVAASIGVLIISTFVPISTFGMVYGPKLAEWGDETSATSLLNGVFHTSTALTGFVANQLFRKFSPRKIGLFGSVMYFIGCLSTAFAPNLIILIVCFSGIQGFGFGLMIPSVFTTFNDYFDRKKDLMNNLANASTLVIAMGWPEVAKFLLGEYGFKGTVLIFAAHSLHTLPAMAVLQPVKWHLVKKENLVKLKDLDDTKSKKVTDELNLMIGVTQENNNTCKNPKTTEEQKQKGRFSRILESLAVDLLKDPVYVNITIGIAAALSSELAFTALLPLLLTGDGFDVDETARILTIYFASDLICRIMLCIVTAFLKIKNRTIYLFGATFTAIFRILFTLNGSFMWKAVTVGCLGFLRCLLQTPIALVIAERFSHRFANAFSLYMSIFGIVNLSSGFIQSYLKQATGSDLIVVHYLTGIYIICIIPWSIELIVDKFKNNR